MTAYMEVAPPALLDRPGNSLFVAQAADNLFRMLQQLGLGALSGAWHAEAHDLCRRHAGLVRLGGCRRVVRLRHLPGAAAGLGCVVLATGGQGICHYRRELSGADMSAFVVVSGAHSHLCVGQESRTVPNLPLKIALVALVLMGSCAAVLATRQCSAAPMPPPLVPNVWRARGRLVDWVRVLAGRGGDRCQDLRLVDQSVRRLQAWLPRAIGARRVLAGRYEALKHASFVQKWLAGACCVAA